MNNSELDSLMNFIERKSHETMYGEIHIVLKLHDGKPTLLEKSVVVREQLSGKSRGSSNERY